MRQFAPLGIKLISYIYLVNAVLFLLSQGLFYNRVIILGKEAAPLVSFFVRVGFALIPLYLYLRLRRLKIDAWFLALIFHLYFIFNNSIGFLEFKGFLNTLVRFVGIHDAIFYTTFQSIFVVLNILLNFFMFVYLLSRRPYFLFKA